MREFGPTTTLTPEPTHPLAQFAKTDVNSLRQSADSESFGLLEQVQASRERPAYGVDGALALTETGLEEQYSSARILADQEPVDFNAKIVNARDVFLAKEHGKQKKMVAYELEQDALLYRVLAKEQGESTYEAAKESLAAYTKMQLETHLGERLNVGISEFTYRIVDGELRTEDTDESALEMIKRGRDYRRQHGKPIDWDREQAEVPGFSRSQAKLTDKNTPIGDMMLFVSPPGDKSKGSIYGQNFYDVFQKMRDGTVVVQRYTSGLTPEESQARLSTLDPRYNRSSVSTAAEFLANPVHISERADFHTPEDVHAFMHKDHTHMSKGKFAVIIQACQPIIQQYTESLQANPDDKAQQEKLYRALLNYADKVADALQDVSEDRIKAFSSPAGGVRPWLPPKIDVSALAQQRVRVVSTGCGDSGDNNPYSVAEFSDNLGSREFDCPTCHLKNIRPQNALVANCQHCGSSSVSCETPKEEKVEEKEEKSPYALAA